MLSMPNFHHRQSLARFLRKTCSAVVEDDEPHRAFEQACYEADAAGALLERLQCDQLRSSKDSGEQALYCKWRLRAAVGFAGSCRRQKRRRKALTVACVATPSQRTASRAMSAAAKEARLSKMIPRCSTQCCCSTGRCRCRSHRRTCLPSGAFTSHGCYARTLGKRPWVSGDKSITYARSTCSCWWHSSCT